MIVATQGFRAIIDSDEILRLERNGCDVVIATKTDGRRLLLAARYDNEEQADTAMKMYFAAMQNGAQSLSFEPLNVGVEAVVAGVCRLTSRTRNAANNTMSPRQKK